MVGLIIHRRELTRPIIHDMRNNFLKKFKDKPLEMDFLEDTKDFFFQSLWQRLHKNKKEKYGPVPYLTPPPSL